MYDANTIIASATAALGIIRTISEITKDEKVKSKAAELTNVIISVQSELLVLQQRSLELVNTNEELKKQIAAFDDWGQTQKQYELVQTPRGAVVYQPRPTHPEPTPKRFYCPKCFADKSLYILQQSRNVKGSHICNKCNSYYQIDDSNAISMGTVGVSL